MLAKCTRLQEYNNMLLGLLPSEVVATEYPGAFWKLANSVIDVDRLTQLKKEYYGTMMADERLPGIPTREWGVWKVCTQCTRDGRFIDERTKKKVFTNDWRFQAAHVFRWIGYVLADAGHTCSALWDPTNPHLALYGPYNPRPCAPLPDIRDKLLQ
jgi:hypothetical protein